MQKKASALFQRCACAQPQGRGEAADARARRPGVHRAPAADAAYRRGAARRGHLPRQAAHEHQDLERDAAWRFAPIGVLSHVERDTLTTGTTANLTAQPVPWGSRERAGEVTKLMADHRAEGAGNCFYSIAPDDVHNALSIRYSFPYRGRDVLGGGREDGVGEGGGGGGGARGPSGRDRGA